ncbi:unnamed protein product, partial [Vitis vinifera]
MSPAMGITTESKQENDPLDTHYQNGVKHLCENGISKVPNKYILPVSERPSSDNGVPNAAELSLNLPVIDFAELQGSNRSQVLKSIANACEEYGFFQLVNHGIPSDIISSMIDVSQRFFDLPMEERAKYMSADMCSPVRYGTSFNQTKDGVFCWRDFLKLMCHPLSDVLPHWPSSPVDFRKLAVTYSKETKYLFLTLMEAILESLGLYDIQGLQIQFKGKWLTVEPLANSFVINIGDHLEIFSNGKYKSVLHRVVVNSTKPRISVASLHSLPFKCMVKPAPQLISQENPRHYKDTDFASFLDYISSCEPKRKNFLESRKLS